ncbi:Flavin-dependent oxidoreductase, luciferase family (includes alkanesulfonate monooxygenase SsuD and methylene tetrahydromethanopterin reductase) [Streptomyces sp. LamerLS-316]|uniref:LLM class flavin-dependent oxidoreductase n=1 Tax=unclassified Streptomyces TaxID=2593676 RepID=UPI000823BBB7|nr:MULTISPECIES: LLM class flavin-dependent oxidoreductase [unclassified Streptomyces]MYQ37242.1 LLM class flavin-dependent oxidoreductase [Streptomyces sp. SID4921]SCK22132.1 Flavin-dependent oxidoreductase, luciferase family (includes alkanesulfonate monooxygenase SsuD and methylene tetrahydromethanopterin reductase) [Streptomyces sp. LamerLS-316]
MKFSVLSLVGHAPHPLTGELPSAADRFTEVLETGAAAERLGFDAYAIGERHAGPFLSSSPGVVLGALAARTSTIRLLTGVTVVAILDPVRVAEEFATLDQIARGRLELVVGKGAEAGHFSLFGLDEERQWDLQKEKYELLRRLWSEEGVDWEGEFRPPLKNVTTVPRPYAGPPRVWHGSATSLNSPELAAEHGDPLFTANAIQPREAYARLIAHYRERFEAYGHDPADARVAAGSGGLLIADTAEKAVERYKELYEAKVAQTFKPHLEGRAGYNTPFRTIEDAIADGPQLIGSPQQIIDKILGFHAVYRHDLQSITVDGFGLPHGEQLETLQRFAEEIAPVVRREAPSSLWE